MKNIVFGVVLASVASQAMADTSGAFAEVLLGKAKQTASVDGEAVSADDVSFGVRGGFNFNSNFAVEVGYHNYGEAEEKYFDEYGDYIVDKFSASALAAGVKASIPFESGFSLFARVGIALWDLKIKETDSYFPGEVFSLSDDGSDFYYGIGAQLKLGERWHIGADYTITDMDVSFDGFSFDHEIKNFALFAGYNF